jgi:phospholipase/lecithinase/hemolysin
MRRMLLPMFALVGTRLAPAGALAEPYSSVYVLGDSLSDQGNLFQATLSVTGSGIPADDHYFQDGTGPSWLASS